MTVIGFGACELLAAGTVVDPELAENVDYQLNFGGDGCIVIVFNNDTNSYDEVIAILLAATGCTFEEAAIETWEIDHLGKSVVHHGSEAECERVAGIIRQIGIKVEVRRD